MRPSTLHRLGYFIVGRSNDYPVGLRRLEQLCTQHNYNYEVVSGYERELPEPGPYFDSILPVRLTPLHETVATQKRKTLASAPEMKTRSTTRFNPEKDSIKLRLKKAFLLRKGRSSTPLPVKEAKQLIAQHALANTGYGIFAQASDR